MVTKNLVFFVNLLDIGVNPEIISLRFGCRLTHRVGPTSTHLGRRFGRRLRRSMTPVLLLSKLSV